MNHSQATRVIENSTNTTLVILFIQICFFLTNKGLRHVCPCVPKETKELDNVEVMVCKKKMQQIADSVEV